MGAPADTRWMNGDAGTGRVQRAESARLRQRLVEGEVCAAWEEGAFVAAVANIGRPSTSHLGSRQADARVNGTVVLWCELTFVSCEARGAGADAFFACAVFVADLFITIVAVHRRRRRQRGRKRWRQHARRVVREA